MVAQLITRLALGGAQEMVVKNAEYLTNQNIKNIILTGKSNANSLAGNDNILLNKAISNNLNLEIIPQLSDSISILDDISSCIAIYRKLKGLNPSVLHIHSSKTGLIGRILKPFFRNTQFIYHVHGWSFSRYSGVKKYFFILIERILYHFTDLFIFVCNEDIKTFISLGGSESIINKSTVIYPGVNFSDKEKLKYFNNSIRNKLGISDKSIVIGNIARLDHQKDPKLFVLMAKEINKRCQVADIKFVWIGAGQLEKECKDLVKQLELEENFLFTGYIDDVSEYFSIFNIFVITSKYEGLPVTAIKAIGSGAKLVSQAVNGLNDLSMYKCVKLNYNRDPILLANKVIDFIELNDCSFELELDTVRFEFSLDKMHSEILKNYQLGKL